jgi:hypothetical protein
MPASGKEREICLTAEQPAEESSWVLRRHKTALSIMWGSNSNAGLYLSCSRVPRRHKTALSIMWGSN